MGTMETRVTADTQPSKSVDGQPGKAEAREQAADSSAPAAPMDDEGVNFALAAARIAADNRAEQVTLLDLRGLSGVADFFVIGTGTSDRQMHAVLDNIEEFGRTLGRKPFRVADSRAGHWLLADYVDVVVHLFDAAHRSYYDLDGLWGDAPRIDWQDQPRSVPVGEAKPPIRE